jgi:hypothetical protein
LCGSFSFLGLLASPTKKGLRKHGREILSSTLFELWFVAAKKKTEELLENKRGKKGGAGNLKKCEREREGDNNF